LQDTKAKQDKSHALVGARRILVVGVRVKNTISPEFPRYEAPSRICDLLGEALSGELVAIKGNDISCELARFVLGVDPPTTKTRTALAEKLLGWGVADKRIADLILDTIPRLPLGKRVFEFGPIEQLGEEFDVALRVEPPGTVMERIISFAYSLGQQTRGDLNGVAGVCGECIARVLGDGGAWLSAGCRGSRPRAGLGSNELLHATSRTLLEKLEGVQNG